MQVDPANFLDALKGEEHKEEHAAFAEVLARATTLGGGVPVSPPVVVAEEEGPEEEGGGAAGAGGAAAPAAPALPRKHGRLEHRNGCRRFTLKKLAGRCKPCADVARETCLVLWRKAKEDGWRPSSEEDGLSSLKVADYFGRRNVARHHNTWSDALVELEGWRSTHQGLRQQDDVMVSR